MQSWQPHICGTHLQSRSDNDDGNDDNNQEQKNIYLKRLHIVPTISLNSAQHKVLKKLRSIISAYGVREHSLTEYSCKIKHVFTSKRKKNAVN